jgi:acetoacetate decarboxylase
MTSVGSMQGAETIRLETVTDQSASPAEMPSLTPAWRLKIIPRADGPGPALKQLIDCTRATKDLVVHSFARGKGTLTLSASSSLDLTLLNPVTVGDAFFMEADYSEDYAEIVYDYLKK